jgi:hypothetical protein
MRENRGAGAEHSRAHGSSVGCHGGRVYLRPSWRTRAIRALLCAGDDEQRPQVNVTPDRCARRQDVTEAPAERHCIDSGQGRAVPARTEAGATPMRGYTFRIPGDHIWSP